MRVQRIGFCELAERFGEVPHLTGIDDGYGQRRQRERGGDVRFIAAGGLEDDEARGHGAQARDQLGQAAFIMRVPRSDTVRPDVHIEMSFRDIETDIAGHQTSASLRTRPLLRSGVAPHAPVRALTEKWSAAPSLRAVLKTVAGSRATTLRMDAV